MEASPLPLLLAVRVVADANGIDPDSPIAETVNAFVDSSRRRTIPEAARMGSVSLLQRLELLDQWGGFADFYDKGVIEEGVREAARGNHIEAVKWLLLVWGRLSLSPWSTDRCVAAMLIRAAVNGSACDVLRWVGTQWPANAAVPTVVDAVVAASRGSIETIEWILARALDRDVLFIKALQAAAVYGHCDLLQWLHTYEKSTSQGIASTHQVDMTRVAAHGRLEILQWFHRYRPSDLQGQLLDAAAESGHLDVVIWLHEIKHDSCASCSSRALGLAAEGGHLDVVQWMLLHRSDELPSQSLPFVARNGHLHVLQWLYDHPHCRELFTSGTTSCLGDAASSGNLAMVKWLHSLQPHLPAWRAIDRAAAHGHLDVLQWLHRFRPRDSCCARAMDQAASCGHLDVVQFLHFHRHEGCTTDAMDGAAVEGHLDIVRFLHANRTEGCTTAAMDEAAEMNHFDVVQFLDTHRPEGCTTLAMEAAIRHGNLEMMRYLHRRRPAQCGDRALALVAWKRRLDCFTQLLTNENSSSSDRVACIDWLLADCPGSFHQRELLQHALLVARRTPGIRHLRLHVKNKLVELLADERREEEDEERPTKRPRRLDPQHA